MASSLTRIVAALAAAAAGIAQNVRKELAYVVVVDVAVKAFCGDVCRMSTTTESASSLREREQPGKLTAPYRCGIGVVVKRESSVREITSG